MTCQPPKASAALVAIHTNHRLYPARIQAAYDERARQDREFQARRESEAEHAKRVIFWCKILSAPAAAAILSLVFIALRY